MCTDRIEALIQSRRQEDMRSCGPTGDTAGSLLSVALDPADSQSQRPSCKSALQGLKEQDAELA